MSKAGKRLLQSAKEMRDFLEHVRKLEAVYDAARGLCFGVDWNNGVAAIKHGYRQKLIEAVNAIKPTP